MNPGYHYFNKTEFDSDYNRIAFCYAFMKCPALYYQEISVLNAHPKKFRPGYFLPEDAYVFIHHVDNDADKPMPSLEEFVKIVRKAGTPITCIGSHDPDFDRTLQVQLIPESLGKLGDIAGRELLIMRWLVDEDEDTDYAEEEWFDTYNMLTKENK